MILFTLLDFGIMVSKNDSEECKGWTLSHRVDTSSAYLSLTRLLMDGILIWCVDVEHFVVFW